MIKNYLFLAVKNVRRRGLRSWLTMLGIFIGIAAVVSLISLGSGLREAVLGQFTGMGSDKLAISNAETGFGPPGSLAVIKLTQHDVNIIKQVTGVDQVIPRLLRPVTIEYNKIIGFGYAVSMPPDSKQINLIYDIFKAEAETGRLLNKDDNGKILLGHDFSKIKSYEKDIVTGSRIKIQGTEFTVIGIMKATSTFEINQAILMTEDDLNNILKIKDEFDIIAVQIVKGADIEEVSYQIKEALRKDRNEKVGKEDFNVQTPINVLKSVNTILNIINLIVSAIAGISLFVGGIGIANTMYTSVLERKKEIGVMKAVGAKNSGILWIFVFEAGFLGLVGGGIGAAIGVGLSFGIAAIANAVIGSQLFIVQFSLPLVAGAFAFSFVIGIISGVLPAMQASKLRPVDALRG